MSYFIVGAAIVSALTTAAAAYQQARTNKAIAKNNQEVANFAADDAQRRGETKAMESQRKARQVASAQRAAYAARGLDMSVGTPADVIEQTDFFGQADAATARDNAAKEAWGLKMQGRGFGIQASAANGNEAFATSLLGSAGAVSDKWYTRTGGGK